MYESFKDYVAVEVLDGENMYDAGCHGLQVGITHWCVGGFGLVDVAFLSACMHACCFVCSLSLSQQRRV